MKILSINQIINLHEILIKKFGGIRGFRDEKLLESSINSAFQTFNFIDLYEGKLKKIIHITYSIIKNHPFIDGNKRVATHVMLILLELNEYKIDYLQSELILLILDLASSKKEEKDLLKWVQNHLI